MINKFVKINLMKFMLIFMGLLIVFSYSAGHSAAASGNVIYVNGSSGNDANNGYTWNTAKLTIENATDTVTSGGTVKIANGIYNENNITLNKNMTITGLNQNKTIINGTNTNSIFIIPSGVKVIISKLTLTNGGNLSNYGVIDNDGTLTVKNCNFTGNSATNGGAIENSGILTVTGSTFTGNSATFGGGAIYNDGTLTVKNCTFTSNTASLGGAIFNEGVLTIKNSTFTNNSATFGGGAIYSITVATLTLIVKNCNFTGNTARIGGAIFNQIDTATATTGDYGSAIFNGYLSTLNVTGCTLTGNKASLYGGAIYNDGTATVHFNRIVGNTAIIGSAIYNDVDGTMDAKLNWWGSNDGTVVANQISNNNGGSVTYTPWIILTIATNPDIVKVGGTSKITAELLYDSNGMYHDPAKGVVPYTGSTDFKTTKGTLVNSNFSNGKAKSKLTNLSTPGVANVSATVDGITVTKTVTIKHWYKFQKRQEYTP